MSETTTETTTPTPKAVAEAAEKGRPGETPEQTIEALRAALAKANDEAKENRLKATELDQIKHAQMSELEKAQAAMQTATQEAAAAKAEALRWRIAAKHGISDEDAETFLTGSDEESLTKQAQRLASLATTSAPATPKPDLTQGGQGAPTPALNSDALEEALRSKLGIA